MTRHFLPFAVLVALLGCGGGGDVAGNLLAPSGAVTLTMSASLPIGLIPTVWAADINVRGVNNPFGVVRCSLTSS